MADPDSVFHHYRKLIQLRKQYDVIRDGSFTLLDAQDEKVFAYTRDTKTGHLLVVCNFTDQTLDYEIPEAYYGSQLLISNYARYAPGLRPYEAVMLYYES